MAWLLLANGLTGLVAWWQLWGGNDLTGAAASAAGVVGAILLLRRNVWGLAGAALCYGLQAVAYHAGHTHWFIHAGISLAYVWPMRDGVLVVNYLALLSLALICYTLPANRRPPSENAPCLSSN